MEWQLTNVTKYSYKNTVVDSVNGPKPQTRFVLIINLINNMDNIF